MCVLEVSYLATFLRLQSASTPSPPASEAHFEGSGPAVTSVKATGVAPSTLKQFNWNAASKFPC